MKKGQRDVSNPYGYDGRPQDRPAPPPGVLPPPQAVPWQQGPPQQYQQPAPYQQQGGPQQGGQYPQYQQPGGQYPQQGQQYPGQWAQPYYGGPGNFNGFQPQRRKSGAGKFVLIGFVVVAFLGITLAVLGVMLGGGTATTADPSVSGPSIVPTATTKPQEGSAEDYLLNSSLYQAGALEQMNCPAEKLGDGSLAAQKRYYTKLFSCLNDAWRPVFAKIGEKQPDPGLVVFDKPVTTPCGSFKPLSGRVLAFYCYGNHVMYTDVLQMNKAFGAKEDLAYLMTIAHEYGHHVQGVSGLFYARAVYLQDHPDQKLESSRRNELQASCLGGVFSKAVARSYPLTNRLKEFEYQASNSFGETSDTPEDERTHGLATSQGFWIENGFNVGETKACNTFAAPGNLVN
ncbi:neutral zinc metallopeptidase [Kribbella qitaiheensis]|uniref:neutral zinc metallopeptidase n=1 Tax=Kribbella qitaiheensis TaxID=1544730 RepID=UPI001FE376E2|nr:neutral zinc metallopeptidase [Kribbella qitaiheensis]